MADVLKDSGQDSGDALVGSNGNEQDTSSSVAHEDPFDAPGTSLFGDADVTPSAQPATPDAATPDTPAFDPDNVEDLLRLDLNNVPEGQRSAWAAAQKTAKNLQGLTRRETERLNQTLQQVEQLQQKLQTQLQQPPQTQQQPGQPGTPSEATAYLDPQTWNQLPPQSRQDLGLILQAVQNYMNPHIQSIQTLPQLQETIQGITAKTSATEQASVNAEWQELREAYPTEDVTQWQRPVATLMATINPATKKYFTAKEAYDRMTGRHQTTSQQMTEKEKQLRQNAKQAAGGVAPGGGGNVVDTSQTGEMSEEEGQAQIAQMFNIG